jgi:hypothetical protein
MTEVIKVLIPIMQREVLEMPLLIFLKLSFLEAVSFGRHEFEAMSISTWNGGMPRVILLGIELGMLEDIMIMVLIL